mmetsp:Transcript_22270/g.51001  ORF Transcript_22270/g.51001 Transcript_22270/m.51001 type:complete len:217 (-) Transcript_22270:179-829(-)
MSFGGAKYGGGRTNMGVKVILNIYDLSPLNSTLCPLGLGVHHSGVQVMGTEYTFAAETGIYTMEPRSAVTTAAPSSSSAPSAPAVTFRESVELGVFEGTQADLRAVLDDLRSEFRGDAYHTILQNCNHFANALSYALVGKTIPPHVNRIANLFGSCCHCLIPGGGKRQLPREYLSPLQNVKSFMESGSMTSAGEISPEELSHLLQQKFGKGIKDAD